MERWQNKIAVVTGASSGIGAAIAIDLTNAGMIVVGLARTPKRIEALREKLPEDKRLNLHAHACDVTDIKSINEAFDWIISKFGGVDVLVNNAAIHNNGELCQMDYQAVQSVVQTNVMGVVGCTQRAFKSMKERNFNGHVVIINSIAGHKALKANIYSPTKFAVTAIAEVYRQEFAGLGTKVKVTSISPGLVNTEMVPASLIAQCGERVLQPENISNAVLYTISTPPNVQIHELTIRPVGETLFKVLNISKEFVKTYKLNKINCQIIYQICSQYVFMR